MSRPDPPVGNGRAIAVLAAREGASVACADRDRAAAEVTAGLARAEGARAEVVIADVTDPLACARVVEESAAVLGGLDGLVLNVGLGLGRGMAGDVGRAVGRDLRRQHQGGHDRVRRTPSGGSNGPLDVIAPTLQDTTGVTAFRATELASQRGARRAERPIMRAA